MSRCEATKISPIYPEKTVQCDLLSGHLGSHTTNLIPDLDHYWDDRTAPFSTVVQGGGGYQTWKKDKQELEDINNSMIDDEELSRLGEIFQIIEQLRNRLGDLSPTARVRVLQYLKMRYGEWVYKVTAE